MRKIYLRNYKGFTDQVINLADVNFFVGENSTGKTSLINLISILSMHEFWFDNQLNNNEFQLGYFDEIHSKNSKDKFFQIGIEKPSRLRSNKNVKEVTSRILIQFKSVKSIPTVEWIRFSFDDLNVHFRQESKITGCYYFFQEIPEFSEWVNTFESYQGENIKIDMPEIKFPLFIKMQIICGKIGKKSSKKELSYDLGNIVLYSQYTWLAPIRAKAKRIYESYNVKFSPEGDHIPSLLRTLLLNTKNKKRTIEILEKFGKESNLFDSISINEFGKKNSPFEIVIKYNNVPVSLPNVGYGVSQILPLVIEMLASEKTMFSIQQPEVHLHPKAQAAFGDFLLKTSQNEGNCFIIETHSDFTINRFRYGLANSSSLKNITYQVLFFERKTEGNCISEIGIDDKGIYIEDLPNKYRDFFIDEELKLLEL